MNRPLVVLAVIICLGILFVNFSVLNFLSTFFIAAIFLISSLTLRDNNESKLLTIFSLFFASMALFYSCVQPSKCNVTNFISFKKENCLVLGVIKSQPERKGNLKEFIFSAKEIDFGNLRHTCCGNILVKIDSPDDYYPGETLILSGSLHKPYLKIKNTSKNYQNYLISRDIYALMEVPSGFEVTRVSNNSSFGRNFPFWLKIRSQALIYRYLDGAEAAVLEAMVLGEKNNLPKKLVTSMILSGTIHILVVSGYNVGIVCFIAALLLKLIRVNRKMRIVLSAAVVLLYCLVTGASTPVVRATIMAYIFLFAYLFRREGDIYNSLALAAFIILLLNPRQLFDVGFQLSFLSVFCIIYFYPIFKNKFCPGKIKNKIIIFFLDAVLVSFSAWLGTMGVIAYNFRIFAPVTIIANIFIVPIAGLITLCGFGIIIFGQMIPFLAQMFAVNARVLITALFIINNFMVKIPGAYYKF